MSLLPDRDYPRRMRLYLSEMFPVPARLLAAVALFGSLALLLGGVEGVPVPLVSPSIALGAWSFFTMMLILRLMDELKDTEVDRRLFRHRPVPSGRVRESDISFSLGIAVILYVAPNLWSPRSLGTALLALGYSFLMFRFFFIPDRMRSSLPLALLTHCPITPLLFLHGTVLFAVGHGIPLSDLQWPLLAPVIAVYWLLFVGWEMSRKMRAAEEEDDYVTYTRLLGRRGAPLALLGLQVLVPVLGVVLWAALSLSILLPAIWFAGFALLGWGVFRFIRSPTPATSRLRPFAEAHMLAVVAGVFAEFGSRIQW